MRRTSHRILLLLLAAIIMAASLPVSSTCTEPARDECAPSGCCEGDGAEDRSDIDGLDCGLPCCAGIAMIIAAAPLLAVSTPVAMQTHASAGNLPRVDHVPLGHPPRA